MAGGKIDPKIAAARGDVEARLERLEARLYALEQFVGPEIPTPIENAPAGSASPSEPTAGGTD